LLKHRGETHLRVVKTLLNKPEGSTHPKAGGRKIKEPPEGGEEGREPWLDRGIQVAEHLGGVEHESKPELKARC